MTPTQEEPRIVRCQISGEMAFPVGYEILRQHFGALVPWSEVRFYFCNHPTTFASEFARLLRDRAPYCVLRVERRPESHTPSHQPAHWHFTIYPVPRDLKSIARAVLISTAFSEVRGFITRAPTHANYYNRIDAVFDPSEGTCATELLHAIWANGLASGWDSLQEMVLGANLI